MPASGLSGENVSKRDPAGPLSAWYDGPTLLEAINAFSPAPNAADKPFRMCVADVSSSGKVRSSVWNLFTHLPIQTYKLTRFERRGGTKC